jgi:hypothetical protein
MSKGLGRHLVVPLHVPFAAVGVDAGVEQHDRIVEVALGSRVFGVEQVVDHLHHGFGGYRFVAVHVVAHPGNGRGVAGSLSFGEADAFEVVRADFLQAAQVGRRGHHQYHQGTALVGGAVRNQFGPAGEAVTACST